MNRTSGRLRLARLLLAAGLVGSATAAAQGPEQKGAPAHSWGETYRLANGLRVVLSADARFPTVTVLVRYHVGARQEPPGASGMAHLLEHLSFRVPRPAVKAASHSAQFTVSSRNGTTSYEETEYFTTTPSADLKYALWTERWRMGLKLSDITESDRRQELEVVKNERRQRVEIVPYGAGRHRLWTQLFPRGHPFHDQVIGSMEDLGRITLDQIKTYFSTYYGPNNATLAVVGDFDPAAARTMVAEYFSGLLASPLPPPRSLKVALPASETLIEHREVYGRNPRLHMAWHAPARYSPEHAAGELAAMLLGGLEASRLMMGVPEAVWTAAFQESLLAGSVFHVLAEPSPGVPLEAVHRKVESMLGILRLHPPSEAQMEQAVRRLVRERLLASEDSLRKAQFLVDTLANNRFEGDPLVFETARLSRVTAADVQRFVATHLTAEKRVVLLSSPAAPAPVGP